MKRGIDNADVFLHLVNGILIHYLCFYMSDEFVINLFTDNLIFSCGNGILLADGLYGRKIGDCQYLCGNAFVMRRCKLCTILPVHFVSIVLSRVVAGSNIQTCDAVQFTYCEGQFRSRTKRLEFVCFNSICCQCQSCFLSKFRRHPAGIIGNGNTLILAALFDNVVGKALGCTAYHINVHTVNTGTNHSAKSGGTKLKILVKALLNLLIIILNGS